MDTTKYFEIILQSLYQIIDHKNPKLGVVQEISKVQDAKAEYTQLGENLINLAGIEDLKQLEELNTQDSHFICQQGFTLYINDKQQIIFKNTIIQNTSQIKAIYITFLIMASNNQLFPQILQYAQSQSGTEQDILNCFEMKLEYEILDLANNYFGIMAIVLHFSAILLYIQRLNLQIEEFTLIKKSILSLLFKDTLIQQVIDQTNYDNDVKFLVDLINLLKTKSQNLSILDKMNASQWLEQLKQLESNCAQNKLDLNGLINQIIQTIQICLIPEEKFLKKISTEVIDSFLKKLDPKQTLNIYQLIAWINQIPFQMEQSLLEANQEKILDETLNTQSIQSYFQDVELKQSEKEAKSTKFTYKIICQNIDNEINQEYLINKYTKKDLNPAKIPTKMWKLNHNILAQKIVKQFMDQKIEENIDKLYQSVSRKDFQQVLDEVQILFKKQGNVINDFQILILKFHFYSLFKVQGPVFLIGDIHGQFIDLINILHFAIGKPLDENLNPSQNTSAYTYVFLGDYVDRGPNSFEVITLIFCLKILYPEQFIILRGNHEDQNTNMNYGFMKEILKKYPDDQVKTEAQDYEIYSNQIYNQINSVFNYLPLAAVVNQKYFCIHGGISKQIKSLNLLKNIKQPIEVDQSSEEDQKKIVMQCLWADPVDNDEEKDIQDGYSLENDIQGGRGEGIDLYSKNILEEFLLNTKLEMIIRAHQLVYEGYHIFGNKRGITVFSAPQYTGKQNKAAILQINVKDQFWIHQIDRSLNQ